MESRCRVSRWSTGSKHPTLELTGCSKWMDRLISDGTLDDERSEDCVNTSNRREWN